jgi:hypothetical protein
MKNLCIITSVINISNKPLSYTSTRSVYSESERFLQTIETIKTVREHIKECEILFIESSEINKEYEREIKEMVDHYHSTDGSLISKIEGPYKASGEASQILSGLKFLNPDVYSHIFKISGRYRLNDNFKLEKYLVDDNVFLESENGHTLATVFYKIYDKELYLKALDICSNSSNMLEVDFKNIFGDKLKKIETLGVDGNVSVDGNYVNM